MRDTQGLSTGLERNGKVDCTSKVKVGDVVLMQQQFAKASVAQSHNC